ncbi:MAG: T9SS type A sorting domain-containing protein [bacterium]|nr:T9SS type A sorting domain-containing protein [bacterium]
MSLRKVAWIALAAIALSSAAFAGGNIVFVSLQDGVKIDPATGEYPDMPYIYLLEEEGYTVTTFYNASISTASQETLDTLYNADLIIMGRSTPSTIYMDANKYAWNDIPKPIINLELWNCRSSRLNWFNTTSMVSNSTESSLVNAVINEPADPVFAGLDVSAPVPWIQGAYDAVGATDAGNGIVLAQMETGGTPLFVRFEPDFEFYDGAGDVPAGPRTVIGNGRDNSGAAPFHYYTFTLESEKVFLAEVARLVAIGQTGVNDRKPASAPSGFGLSQNYPNPFNPSTTIEFNLPAASDVRLELVNGIGQVVRELTSGTYAAGRHHVAVDASGLGSGVYFYRLTAGDRVDVKKLMIAK